MVHFLISLCDNHFQTIITIEAVFIKVLKIPKLSGVYTAPSG